MYDFSKKKTGLERFVFALSLDRNKLSERIVIGEPEEVRLRLSGGEGNVYYDQQRPLGQFLIDFEADKDKDWNTNAMLLRQSYEKTTTDQARFKKVKPASDFLQKKYESNEPTAVFAAIRTWEEYLKCFYMNHGPDTFTSIMNVLYRPFFLYADTRPWQEDASDSLSKTIHAGESQVELWYPAKKRPFECVVAMSSFQPLIFYYLNKIEEWGYVFQECKVYNKHFLARSRHYELCS